MDRLNLKIEMFFYIIEEQKVLQTDKFTTDFKEVFGFLQNNNSKQELEEYIQEHREALVNLEEDAYDLICVMSDMDKLRDLKKKPLQKGEYDMCKGLEEMIDDREQQVNKLYEYLYNANRIDDMKKAFTDREYRRQLMKEYGLKIISF